MAIPVSQIINRVQTTLLDETGVYWDQPELIDYLNAAVSALVMVKPDAFTVIAPLTLAANNTRQNLPSDGYALNEVRRNLSPSVAAIIQTDMNHMDHADPDWHSARGTKIENYMYDTRTPKTFFVYPAPSNGSVSIEIEYFAEAPGVNNINDTVQLDMVYENPLYYYTLGHAYAKNAKRGDLVKATTYYNMFNMSLGEKAKVQVAYSPRPPDKG